MVLLTFHGLRGSGAGGLAVGSFGGQIIVGSINNNMSDNNNNKLISKEQLI
nr:3014_t:CDS:2 [Entrophospora candida]